MDLRYDLTLGALLRETAEKYPERPALVWRDQRWTYAELDRDVDIAARGLLKIGATRGSHVGLWSGNRPATVIGFCAAWRIGAVAVMLGGCRKKTELMERIEDADVDVLLYDHGSHGAAFDMIAQSLSHPERDKRVCIETLDELFAMAEGVPEARLRKAEESVTVDDVDTILFTSGSTSKPKGVVTTHFSRVNNFFAQAEILEVNEQDRILCALSLSHCFSISGNVGSAFAAGACTVIPESRYTPVLMDIIQREKCTIFTAVPTMFASMLNDPTREQYDLSSLRTGMIGGASYPAEQFKTICRELDFDLLPSLGQTETSAGLTGGFFSDSLEKRASTVGRFLPHVEGCIINRQGRVMPIGEMGEVCIKGYNVMQGYYKRPDLTAEAIDENGWLHTGDIGYLDEEGYLTLTGRCKDVIIRGGENIAPGEVERVVANDSRVEAVRVFGVPDDYYGEEVCACIVLYPDCEMNEDEVRAAVRKELVDFKVPRYVVFMKEFPLNANGKPDMEKVRRFAREMVLQPK